MVLPSFPRSLGARLALVCALLFALLAAATALAVARGFNHTSVAATEVSATALEGQGRELLIQVTQREAALYASSLQRAADGARQAAAAVVALDGAGYKPGAVLASDAEGRRFDPAPARVSDVLIAPGVRLLDPAVGRDLRHSAALDALFPGVLATSPDAVAVYFAAPTGVVRYYPSIDLQERLGPSYDITRDPVLVRAAPELNPARAVVWRAPYLDDAGNGLLVTASAPVYAGEEFRGVIGVDISLDRLRLRLNSLKPTSSAHALLLDPSGQLIAASPGSLAALGLGADDGAVVVGRDLAASALAPALEALGRGDAGALTLEGAVPVVLAYAPLGEPGWGLAVAAPLAELTGPAAGVAGAIRADAAGTVRATLVVVALSFALALGGIVVLSRRWLTGPIGGLVAATQALGRGDAGARAPVHSDDELGALAASFNRMAGELAAAREGLEARVAERTRELAALLAIGQRVALAGELDHTLATLARSVVVASGAEACAVALLDEAGCLRIVAGEGLPEGYAELALAHSVEDADLSLASRVVSSRQPVVERGVRQRVLSRPALAPLHPLIAGVAWDTLVSVPLSFQERCLGALTTYFRPERSPEASDTAFLWAVADQAAITVENARLFHQAQETAALLERQKLARDLHDSVSQALYGIALGAQTAQTVLDDSPDAARAPLSYVLGLAKAGMAEMRALIFELRPESLEQEGLAAALTKQADALRARYKLDVVLVLGREPEVPLLVKETLYRIAQEALHNIVKHAHAARVWVCLTAASDGLTLEIRDDGIGFDPGALFPGHLGLTSMRERAARVGGELVLISAPGGGTLLRAVIPVG